MFLFDTCPQIYFGRGSLDYLLKVKAEKAVLVTDSYMVSSGMVGEVTRRLDAAKIQYKVYSGVTPDPNIDVVVNGIQVLFDLKPDLVIALGGGSAIDTAKVMLNVCFRIKALLMKEQYISRPEFITIPTTSGSGSEVTTYAVISDEERGIKIPISNRNMVPDVAILDPEFTKTLPKDQISFTGMDVLTHAIEAFVSGNGNDFTNMFAKEAAEIAFHTLPGLYSDASDEKLRERMYNASTMAGLAFTNSGLGLCHGIAHTIGAQFHVPHGKANAIILPYIILFNCGIGEERLRDDMILKYAHLAENMGLGTGKELGNIEMCRLLIMTVNVLNERFRIPKSFKESGIDEAEFNRNIEIIADKVLEDACTKTNPRPVTKGVLIDLMMKIYSGELDI